MADAGGLFFLLAAILEAQGTVFQTAPWENLLVVDRTRRLAHNTGYAACTYDFEKDTYKYIRHNLDILWSPPITFF